MPEAFAILAEDHRKVERLFQQYQQTNDPEVALQICDELTVHAMLEEELVYPLLATKVGIAYAQEAREEHQEAKQLITQIENGLRNQTDVSALIQQLEESVQHHVQEEEQELFPMMQEKVPALVEPLGKDLIERRRIVASQLEEARRAGQPSTAVAYASKPSTNA